MKILFIAQHYWPEIGAASARMTYFAEYLIKGGHTVFVVCPQPNYPEGKFYKGYKNTFFKKEQRNGVALLRTFIFPDRTPSLAKRLCHYLSFMFSSLAIGLLSPRPDVIFVTSPSLFCGVSGVVLKRVRRVPMILDVRDVWPESAQAVGLMRRSFFMRLAENMERWIYRHADTITVTAEGIKKNLLSRKDIREEKIVFLPNGAELDLFHPATEEERNAAKRKFQVEGKFTALYAGNLGLAQQPEVIVSAAELLGKEPRIHFLIAGGGVLRPSLEETARIKRLQNITFLGAIPREKMGEVYAASDLGIISYKNTSLFREVLPSKLFDLWSAAVPVIINLSGEAATLIQNSQSGCKVQEENPEALADKIKEWSIQPEAIRLLGKNGRAFVQSHFNREKIAAKLETIIERMVKSK